jgi:cephalosporin hydroxylase
VDAVRNRTCSELEVDNWQLSRFVLEKLVPVVGVHPFPLQELMLVTAAVCRFRPVQIFEWGTHIGKSARIFHECLVHFGISSEIHSVDLPADATHVEHPDSRRGELVHGIDGVHLHLGDGLDVSLSVWNQLGRKSNVLFFVDGDHEYSSVHRELSIIVREVPTAAILLHDTFYQSPESRYNVGPHRAINDALTATSGYRRLESGLGLPGMTLLYRP